MCVLLGLFVVCEGVEGVESRMFGGGWRGFKKGVRLGGVLLLVSEKYSAPTPGNTTKGMKHATIRRNVKTRKDRKVWFSKSSSDIVAME